MRIRTSRRLIYAAMALTVLSLVGGFSAATITIGQTSSSYQGTQTTTISPVTGLSVTSTNLVLLSSPVTNSSCPGPSGCSVTSASVTDCAGGFAGHTGCVTNDWVEQVTLTTTPNTAFSGVVKITLYVSAGGAPTTGTTFFYSQASGTNSAETIVQDFGVGNFSTGPASVTGVAVVATV
jgi:hypothetical protein